MVTRLGKCSRSWARKSSLVRAGKMVCVDVIALSPIKKVSSYSLVSDKHIKIRLGQSSLYGFPFMLTAGNGYHITILLLGYLSKIVKFDSNKLLFNLLILSSILAYWNVITLRNKLVFIDINSYLFLNSIIGFIFQISYTQEEKSRLFCTFYHILYVISATITLHFLRF